jgi:predicted PurR-regulated permease PerM
VGLEAAPTWGALAFFLNFIPTVGSILAGIPPVLLALLQFYPSAGPALIILIAVVVINQALGNIVAPKIMGDQLNLSPVVILLSVMFWGWLWGIAGAFLSVVITCSIKIVCENIPMLHPVSVMMSSGKAIRKQARAEAREEAAEHA